MLTVIYKNFEWLVNIRRNQCLKFDESSGVAQCECLEEHGPLHCHSTYLKKTWFEVWF